MLNTPLTKIEIGLSTTNITYWLVTLHKHDAYVPGFHSVAGSNYFMSGFAVENKTVYGIYSIRNSDVSYVNLGGDGTCDEEERSAASYEACIDEFIAKNLSCR